MPPGPVRSAYVVAVGSSSGCRRPLRRRSWRLHCRHQRHLEHGRRWLLGRQRGTRRHDGRPTGSGGTFTIGGSGGARPSCNGVAGCNLPIPEGCGDGINNQGGIEVCDDGNTLPGDGCNGACKVEPNWVCPPAGACMRAFRCGDSVINPGEVCDDGNTNNADGCNATCTLQDPGYACTTPGMACTRTSICGNKRVEPGETCDDGNTNASDGCSAACILDTGWACPAPGSPCSRAARCGDGVVNANLGEVCDDGNAAEGDGCSGDCKIRGAGCSCIPGMRCTCPEVRCGNGTIEGTEKCDDGNATAGDGCSATCQLERGYVCPLTRAPCLPDCGDGIVIGNEQCDPAVAVTNMNLACSTSCRWNRGWVCLGTPPTSCRATRCGDNVREGLEGCDDGNTVPFDGCSTDCQNEPTCTSGACTNRCGDGVLLGEACEDGNNLSGDGCSATCQPESGYTCARPPLGDSIQVPIILRDFLVSHIDFEPGAVGQNLPIRGLVANMLDAEGKPVFAGTANQGYISSATSFAQWYRNVANVNHTTATTLTLWNNGAGAYVNRWGRERRAVGGHRQGATTAATSAPSCSTRPAIRSRARRATRAPRNCLDMEAMGFTRLSCNIEGGNYTAIYQTAALDGTPTFFPVDADTFTPAGERSTATIGPPYEPAGGYPVETGAPLHNFGFTSEVRYWFPYDATKSYKLDFLGDDDVWVFINKRLAVDIGGIHTAQPGTITISAANAATYGLTNGNVYEVVVFQAERQKTSSSYKLTLSGFNGAISACNPTCGDRVVTAGEQCDNGTAMNLGGYNQCTAMCKLGPYCGDANPDAGFEDCDNGRNDDAYGAMSGCGPGCKLPARCGDMLVQTEYSEQCDNGADNDGRYTGCTAQCQRAGYCGDGKTQSPQEQCDDGANDGSYGTCGDPSMPLPNCGPLAPLRRRRRPGRVRRAVRAGDVERSDVHGRLPPPRHLRRRGRHRARAVRLRRDGQQRRIRRLRARLHPRPVLRRRDQERAGAVRRRHPRQQLRRLLAAVQAGAPLRRRHGRRGLRAVRRRGQQRAHRALPADLQDQRALASSRRRPSVLRTPWAAARPRGTLRACPPL